MENLVTKRPFANKCCLITGAAGFKGRWLSLLLSELGAEVIGVDILEYDSNVFVKPHDIKFTRLDINNTSAVTSLMSDAQPDIIIHLAAQSLVSESYREIQSTYHNNVMGTLSLLEAIRAQNYIPLLLNITTDKVYHNKEWLFPYRETDELGGLDPYSASKSCVEIMSKSYFHTMLSDEHVIVNVRSGNVIGGGDWSKNRLVPDIFRALAAQKKLAVRNPLSTRPWQHVLDPLLAYLKIISYHLHASKSGFNEYNVGPDKSGQKSVSALLDEFQLYASFKYSIENETLIGHESGLLSLETAKIKKEIGWHPVIDFELGVKLTSEWYLQCRDGVHSVQIMRDQIQKYVI